MLISAGAEAQSRYSCSSNGRSYQSTQPCPGGGLVYYGPTANQQRYEAPIPTVGQAPAHLKYLSPRCASLNDAIRTAPARGLKYDTISQMSKEYSHECSESESEASAQMSQERRDQKQQLKDGKATASQEKERASLREQQCGESKRILITKRARADLTEGEKSELRRFEENYRSRCG
jgi:arsenate reductase-like glutaredoxin family protein